MKVTTLGIDLAKTCFQLHGTDDAGRAVIKRKINREELALFTAQLEPCLIAMEACGGAHYWARKFKSQGHSIKLIPARHVKKFKESQQKNDARDAFAINEAAQRPKMPLVAPKELWQQDVQALHRTRQQLVKMRTATVNQCRGLMMEYGVVVDKSIEKFFIQMPSAIEDANNELTLVMRDLAAFLVASAKDLSQKIEEVEKKILTLSEAQPDYRRLLQVPGIGPMGASMFISSVGDAKVFKNGRHVAAWLGLVPRQESSGGKSRLLGITKTGDNHLRSVLIHGARSLILSAMRKHKRDPVSQWILDLQERKGWNVTAVAIANRNARIMWHLMNYKEEYKSAV